MGVPYTTEARVINIATDISKKIASEISLEQAATSWEKAIRDNVYQDGTVTKMTSKINVTDISVNNGTNPEGLDGQVLMKSVDASGSPRQVVWGTLPTYTKLYYHVFRDSTYGNIFDLISVDPTPCKKWSDVTQLIQNGAFFAQTSVNRGFLWDGVTGGNYRVAIFTSGGVIEWVTLIGFSSDTVYPM